MAASKMASSVEKASDMLYDYMCTTCEESELNKEALYNCDQCTKLYCDDCAKAHNVMYKKHKLLDKKDVSKWGAPRPTVRGQQCPLHAGNVIQMYCTQHDVVGCTVCFYMDHRDCKTTQHIPDVAKGIFQSSEFKNLPAIIKSSQDNLRKKKKTKKQHIKVVDDTCDNIIKSAKDTRKRVDREMARMEKKTIEDVEELRATLKAALKADVEGFEKEESELQQFLDAFQDKAQQHETSAFVRLKTCKQKLREAENLLKSISEEPFQIRFSLYNEIEKNLSSFQSLGALDVLPKSSATKPSAGAQHPASSVSHRKQAGQAYSVEKCQVYSLHIKNDKISVLITGLCSLPNGNFLAVDYYNNKVKQLNGQFNVISHLDIPSRPHDICHLGDYQVAVTVGNQIHFLDASNNQLTLTKKVTSDHNYAGIDYHNDQLYVTSDTALYIYNRSGQLVKKLYEDMSAPYTVNRVSVAKDDQHIYVTNYSNHQLITLDNQGNKLATFSDPDLEYPRGLCTAENGTVFVCGGSSYTVVQVTSDGTKKLATVAGRRDGVYGPHSLLFHEATSQLIVGQYDNNKSLLVMKAN